MHTTSVEEDWGCHGEDRTSLPQPLDAALQPSCGKWMPSPPAHGQTRTAGWLMAERPLAALGHRQRSKRHSSREETPNHSQNNSVIWMHDAHEHPSEGLAAKKHNLA
jgi:hypothetical protein